MDIAQISRSERPGYISVVTPYKSEFVEELKWAIPHPHRLWDNEMKCWLVSEAYLPRLMEILDDFYDEIINSIVKEEPIAQNLFKSILDILPDEYVQRVYSALAQAVHPDHGGSVEQMTQLNLAYEERRKIK